MNGGMMDESEVHASVAAAVLMGESAISLENK